jgi:hypothetical protein
MNDSPLESLGTLIYRTNAFHFICSSCLQIAFFQTALTHTAGWKGVWIRDGSRTLYCLCPSCLVQLTYIKQVSITDLFVLSIEELVRRVLYRGFHCRFVSLPSGNTIETEVSCRECALSSLYVGPTSSATCTGPITKIEIKAHFGA